MKLDREFIIFDLDGTIADSEEGIINSAIYALERFGFEYGSREELRKFIGPPLRDSFIEFCGFDGEKADEATAVYREYYSVKGLYECRIYEGIPQVLEALKSAGKKLYLATSKTEVYAREVLRYFGLTGYFEFAGGAQDKIRTGKSKVLRYVIEEGGITDLGRAVMIGDRTYDITGASAMGIDAIGVLYGFGSEEELINSGAAALAKTPMDLLSILL
jgi:phosphoglycolate phosphatase